MQDIAFTDQLTNPNFLFSLLHLWNIEVQGDNSPRSDLFNHPKRKCSHNWEFFLRVQRQDFLILCLWSLLFWYPGNFHHGRTPPIFTSERQGEGSLKHHKIKLDRVSLIWKERNWRSFRFRIRIRSLRRWNFHKIKNKENSPQIICEHRARTWTGVIAKKKSSEEEKTTSKDDRSP